jgi:hypothetical protein
MPFISNGTTILDNGAFSVSLGSKVLLSTATASASASLSFNSTYINSTYPIYKFEFINCHPATDTVDFQFNLSTDNGSNYNVTKTSTYFSTYHYEDGAISNLLYQSDKDLAQGTGEQQITDNSGNGNDECWSGSLTLFNPSSTTYVKHFISRINSYSHDDASESGFVGGYANTTSAVNAIRFKMSSGNIDAGTIKLYGIKDS